MSTLDFLGSLPHIGCMNDLRTQLLDTAAIYCAARSITLSTLSHKIMNDGKVLPRLAKGGHDITTETFERFVKWFRENWPVGGKPMPRVPYDVFY